MNNLKVYTVYDSKAECYMQPFFMMNKGTALRAWQNTVNDQSTEFNRHPEDYTLFEIGEFDQEKGIVIPHEAKISLGTALEFKKEMPPNMADIRQAMQQKRMEDATQ